MSGAVRRSKGFDRPRRRGVAVLLVLMLLTMTLGLSYAMVRSQNTAAAIERNAGRKLLAREAAMTGMSAALRKIHRNTWGGVATTLSGALGAYERYDATYTAGDASLATTDPFYPYRVTILSTGYSTDPSDAQRVAQHRIRAVVELVQTPQSRLAAAPSGWDKVAQSTVFQYSRSGSFIADVTFRIAGRVELCSSSFDVTSYNWGSGPRDRYFTDLEAMRLAGLPDWRPFNGPVYLYDVPDDETSENLVRKLGINFGLTTSNYSSLVGDAGSTYRVYERGPEYSIELLGYSSLQNYTFQPNLQTNPLRLINHTGSVNLNNNVTVNGTLVVTNDLYVNGTNVRLTPADLPRLQGQTKPLRLPTAVVQNDLDIRSTAAGELTGVFNVADKFVIDSGSQTSLSGLAMQMRIVANNFSIGQRTEWDQSSFWWDLQYNAPVVGFNAQKNTPPPAGTPYFPEYLRLRSPLWPRLQPEPKIVIAPASDDAITYHWNADPAGSATSFQDGIYRFEQDTSVQDGKGHTWELKQWKDGV